MATNAPHSDKPDSLHAELGRYSGLYLTFRLGQEIHGAPILKIREIISMLEITRVPRTKPWLAGVINLRGKVIPVVTLRRLLGMEQAQQTEETCIIVVETQSELIGVIIDEVSEVVDIHADWLEPVPEFGTEFHADFLLAMGKVKDKVVTLLDLDRILDIHEFSLS